MDIRDAVVSDADSIQAVARLSWETDYPESVSRETVPDAVEEWYGDERIAGAVRDSGTELLVAEADGEVVGFAHGVVSTERWTGTILRVYVHPEKRQRGAGRALVEAMLDRFATRDVDDYEAMVLADNELGNEFYRSLGFEQVDSGQTEIGGTYYEEHRYVREP